MESTTELIQGAEARILIVEDDPILLPLLETHYRRLFEAQGYETVTVETAKSADEAKERARKATRKPYDFVSLDVNLGKTSTIWLRRFNNPSSAVGTPVPRSLFLGFSTT